MLLGYVHNVGDTCFAYGTLTHSGPVSHQVRLHASHINVPVMLDRTRTPHNTQPATPARLTLIRFRLIQFRSPLLPESLLFSLPTGTEMFHFPAFPPHTLYIQMRVTTLTGGGVSPFGHPRINARLSAPRGLSQISTSFIGS